MKSRRTSGTPARAVKRKAPPARRTPRSSQEIMNRIVKAATREFGRHGFAGATTAAIARNADVTETQLFQLCDAPREPIIEDYLEEAVLERMVPGEGELPLFDMLAALPRDRVLGLEVPMRREAEAGVGPHERLGRCVQAARALIARLPPPARA